LVSFARPGRSKAQSFPRKRESSLPSARFQRLEKWITAFAGMTGNSKGIRCQMTRVLGWHIEGACGGRAAISAHGKSIRGESRSSNAAERGTSEDRGRAVKHRGDYQKRLEPCQEGNILGKASHHRTHE